MTIFIAMSSYLACLRAFERSVSECDVTATRNPGVVPDFRLSQIVCVDDHDASMSAILAHGICRSCLIRLACLIRNQFVAFRGHASLQPHSMLLPLPHGCSRYKRVESVLQSRRDFNLNLSPQHGRLDASRILAGALASRCAATARKEFGQVRRRSPQHPTNATDRRSSAQTRIPEPLLEESSAGS